MKRIYNKVYRAAMAALVLTAATACTGDNDPLQNNDIPPTGRPITVTATYQEAATPDGTDAQTRTTYELNYTTRGMDVKWKAGDKIYIINAEDLKAGNSLTEAGFEEFTLDEGAGSTSGTFKNPDSRLDMNKQLYAVYCGDNASGKISVNDSQYYQFSLAGQRQVSNENTGHLADYDLMWATVDANAATKSFNFKHVNAILKLSLFFEYYQYYYPKEVKITTARTDLFRGSFTVLPSSGNIAGVPTYTQEYTLALGNNEEGITVNSSFLVYMMVCSNPIYANQQITITVTCKDGVERSATITMPQDFVMNPGTFNTIKATVKKTTTD